MASAWSGSCRGHAVLAKSGSKTACASSSGLSRILNSRPGRALNTIRHGAEVPSTGPCCTARTSPWIAARGRNRAETSNTGIGRACSELAVVRVRSLLTLPDSGRPEDQCVTHQTPMFGAETHGSASGSASPFCSSSIEMLSGVRMKAMRPSRGGRLIVTPAFCSLAQ